MNIVPDDDEEALARREAERQERVRVARLEQRAIDLNAALQESEEYRDFWNTSFHHMIRQHRDDQIVERRKALEERRQQVIRNRIGNAVREYHLQQALQEQSNTINALNARVARLNVIQNNNRTSYDSLMDDHVDTLRDLQLADDLNDDRAERIRELEDRNMHLDPPQG